MSLAQAQRGRQEEKQGASELVTKCEAMQSMVHTSLGTDPMPLRYVMPAMMRLSYAAH